MANNLFLLSCTNAHIFLTQPSHLFQLHLTGSHQVRLLTNTKRGHAFRVLANPDVSPKERKLGKVVIMVDPLEAKRLAAKQMAEIKAQEKLKRRRRIEAINGAWAMLGLTAGLIIEGHTGKSILEQLGAYWLAIVSLFVR